jgi:hypothetical protein
MQAPRRCLQPLSMGGIETTAERRSIDAASVFARAVREPW